MWFVILATLAESRRVHRRVEEQECRPVGDRFWFVGAHHKTGTALMDLEMLVTTSPVVHYDPSVPVGMPLKDGTVGSFEEVPKGTIAVWTHMFLENGTQLQAAEKVAEDRNQRLKMIFFVRDPLEIIVAGYFYHLTTSEWWVHTPMHTLEMFHIMAAPCDLPDGAWISPFTGDPIPSCIVSAFVDAQNATYQDMLRQVDRNVGAIIEADRALGEISELNSTVVVLKQFPSIGRVYDLNAITESSNTFDATFTDIFSFLGVTDVPSCVAKAAKWDLHRRGPSPRSIAHELTHDRDALRALLPSHPWFHRFIQPFRIDMHYAEPPKSSIFV